MLEVKRATVNLQGSARLEEIRASLAAEKSGASAVDSAPADPGHRGQRRRVGRHIRRPVDGCDQGPRYGWLSAGPTRLPLVEALSPLGAGSPSGGLAARAPVGAALVRRRDPGRLG